MADQIMETLTNEEHERLLLMSEHAIASPLSPAAQAIINAAVVAGGGYGRATPVLHARLAAALRAAAKFIDAIEPEAGDELLAIAAELEAQ